MFGAGGDVPFVAPTEWPQSAAALNTAIGGGTWSHGWDFNETSGTTVTASFGGVNGTLSTATGVTYEGSGFAAFDKTMWNSSSTGRVTLSNVVTSSTRGFLLCFTSADVASNTFRNLVTCAAAGTGFAAVLGPDGKLWIHFGETIGTVYGGDPARNASNGGTYWVSTFNYNDDTNHMLLVWFDTSTDTAYISTDLEHAELAIPASYAPSTHSLSLMNEPGGMTGYYVRYSYFALATATTGLDSNSVGDFWEWLYGYRPSTAKTAWPTQAQLETLIGIGADASVFTFEGSGVPIASSEGVSFDTATGTIHYDNGEFFTGAGGAWIMDLSDLTTPASGAGSIAATSTPIVGIVWRDDEKVLSGAARGYTQHNLVFRSAAGPQGYMLSRITNGGFYWYYQGDTGSAGIAGDTNNIMTGGLHVLIGAQAGLSDRFVSSLGKTASNTTTVTADTGNVALQLAQSSASEGMVSTTRTVPLNIQYMFVGANVGTITTATAAMQAARKLLNWFARATRAAPTRLPSGSYSWAHACSWGNDGTLESNTVAYDMTAAAATAIDPIWGSNNQLVVDASQTNPSFDGGGGILARNKAVAFTDSSTVGLRNSANIGFSTGDGGMLSFKIASAPAGTRQMVHFYDLTTLVGAIEVLSSGHVRVRFISNSGASEATATIAADHCDGNWHHLFFTIYEASTKLNVKASTDLGDATGQASAGAGLIDTTFRVAFGGSVSGGPTVTSAACVIGAFATTSLASATSAVPDPKAYRRNWEKWLSGAR